MLDIININCKYGEDKIFDSLTINDIKPGLNFIIGRSGCGKSSLVKLIMGIIPLDEGEIAFNGAKITDFEDFRSKYVSYVFQESMLIPYFTIKENLLMISNDINKIKKVLSSLYLIDKINDYPRNLSGGEKQRINIARAILKKSFINIFDEPTSSVNKNLKEEIMELIRKEFSDTIVIIISHNNLLISKYADRIIDLENKKDIVINTLKERMSFETGLKPSLLSLTLKSYTTRSKAPFIVISMVLLIVILSLSLFSGIENYIDYNIKRKPDYNYFYLSNGENIISKINDIYNIQIVENYREYMLINYRQKIKTIDNKNINDFFEIKISSKLKNTSINNKFFNLINSNYIKINDKKIELEIINDGELYTSPAIYFNYDQLKEYLGIIQTQEICFKTDQYKEVYKYLISNYKNKYSLDINKDDVVFDNSTIMINESLKPFMNSIHTIIMLLSYSILVMAFSFIRTLVTYNINIRADEIKVYHYFGYKNKDRIVLYEILILIGISLSLSLLISLFLCPIINNITPFILHERFSLIRIDSRVIAVLMIIIFILINLLIIENKIENKNKNKTKKPLKI